MTRCFVGSRPAVMLAGVASAVVVLLAGCIDLAPLTGGPGPAGHTDWSGGGPEASLGALAAPADEGDAKTGPAGEADGEKKRDDKKDRLTLERIFPEKSFFGPTARAMEFSRDGRFCAFLYRPWIERRHGSDLYIYDTHTAQVRRVTSVGRMSEFQAETREVRDDREKKAKKAGVTLAQLAREQAERRGWTDGWLTGDWEGEATSDGTAVPPGEAALTLDEGKGGALSGEIRIGLVRLPVKSGEHDEEQGSLEAKVDDPALKVKGDLALSLADGALRGELKLTEPEQILALNLTRKPPDEEARKKNGPAGVIGAIGERLTLGDVVLDDDAEINDEKDGKPPKDPAPRYDGISSIEWSPIGPELLVLAGGDIYLLKIDVAAWDAPFDQAGKAEASEPEAPSEGEAAGGEAAEQGEVAADGADLAEGEEEENADSQGEGEDAAEAEETDKKAAGPKKKEEAKPVAPYRGELTRLTRTREREADVQYLPDGSGYTYLRAGALVRVSFGDHRIVQLDPELKDGERMVGYRISPDQKRLVFLANRGGGGGGGRQVTIVSYRDRFARAREVPRHMPDDPWPETYTSVYLYDLKGHEGEKGTLERVFTRRVSGPRDVMRVPEWSPDSKRIAFAAFEQASGHMKILEAGFVDEKKKEEEEKAAAETEPADPAQAKKDGEKEEQQEEQQQEEQQQEEQEEEKQEKQEEEQEDGQKEDGGKQDGGAAASPGEQPPEEEEPEFKIENARVVYEFLHHGGPNTPGMVHPQYLPDSRRMIFITELSGFRHLHLLDPRYEELTQVTHGQYEVYPFHLSEDHSTLFVTATEADPNQEHVYKINLATREATRLSQVEGVYSGVAARDDGTRLLALQSDFGAPTELVAIIPGEESPLTRLTDSHPEEAHKLTSAAPEYFTYENRHGQVIHGHMFKPKDWTPKDKRPLLVYVYGGPLGERKMATRGSYAAPSYFFARYMAENHGYVCVTIDPRGASGYGAVFEKANFEQVGKPQTEDLVDGARWLAKNHGVDQKRMALHGWSFGGFQTQMVMYTEPDVFAVGIAGAGPTEWHNYNSWYSTGTIGANQPGKTDLEKYSLLPLAKNLKGRLMLVHGMEDSNVLYQDTVRVYRELLKADKEVLVELFLDPTGGHGLGGDVKTIGRYRKYEDFLLRYLGKGEAARTEEPEQSEPEDAPPAVEENAPNGETSE